MWLTEFNAFKNELDDNPLLFSKAMSHPNWKLQKDAMETEVSNLIERGTQQYIPLSKGANVIGTKFIYKIKQNANGSIKRYKA